MDDLAGRPGGHRPGLHEPGRIGPSPPRPGGTEMIWFTWRQFRVQAVSGAAALAALAVTYAATGPHLAGLYNASGLPNCRGRCGARADSFLNQLNSGHTYPA